MKGYSDRILIKAMEETVSYYGCQHCGMCCKLDAPTLSKKDIKRISEHLKMNPKKFKKKYTFKWNPPEGITYSDVKLIVPCPFHKDNKCSIYSVRPLICRTFPFILTGNILRLDGINLCPVSNVIFDEYQDFWEEKEEIKIEKTIREELDKEGKKITKHQMEEMKKHIFTELKNRWDNDIKDRFGEDMKKEAQEFTDYINKLGLPEFDSDMVYLQSHQLIEFYIDKIDKN